MNKPKLYFMVGLPASGKSYYTKQIKNAVLRSSDLIRKELFNDVNSQEDNSLVFKNLHNRIKSDLRVGYDTIYDATNISYKRRMSFLQELKNIDCEKICVFIATPYEQCLIQNQNRDRVVPENVIKRMYLNFDIPAYFEGFDEIKIEWNFGNHTEPENLIQELCDFEQESLYHTLTLGEHCKETAKKIAIEKSHKDFRLLTAGLYHDIGKVFTQKFENGKGEKTEQAHYLQHHHVSAYEALIRLGFCNINKDVILDIAQLIRWHMYPYNIKQEKTKNKFIRLVGQEFYDRLMILHEADKAAH